MNVLETKDGMKLQGLGEERTWNYYLMGTETEVDDEKVLEMDSGDGYITM